MSTPEQVYQLYTPKRIPPALWEELRPLTIEAARAYYAPSPHGARDAMHGCAYYLAWANSKGLPLTLETLFHPANIERYCTKHLTHYSTTTRASIRAILRAIGPNVTKKAPWPKQPAPIAHKRRTEPYTQEEIAGFNQAVYLQGGIRQRRVLNAIMVLSHGAGLTNLEMARVHAHHISFKDPRIPMIYVGTGTPRMVPVLPRYMERLQGLRDAMPQGPIIGTSKAQHDLIGHLRRGIVLPKELPSLSVSRLRSTWLLHHLDLGTPLNALLGWADIKHAESVTDLLPFMAIDPVLYLPVEYEDELPAVNYG